MDNTLVGILVLLGLLLLVGIIIVVISARLLCVVSILDPPDKEKLSLLEA